jgi:hypothetical protein
MLAHVDLGVRFFLMTLVEPPLMSIWKEARRIAKEQAQAAEPHLTFFFTKTLTPICKNPLC